MDRLIIRERTCVFTRLIDHHEIKIQFEIDGCLQR